MMELIARIFGSAVRFLLRAIVFLLALALKIVGSSLLLISEELFKLTKK